MEKQIHLVFKLYKCRDTAKQFFRELYDEKIEPYKVALETVSASHENDILKSLIVCLQLESIQDNGMAQLLFCAAAVEIIEPTKI
jgi:hypothetical protein